MSDAAQRLPVARPGHPAGLPPVFRTIGIVGLGLIGGSIALAARRIWPEALVIAVDQKDVLEKAVLLHAMDVGADDPVVLAEADLIVLAAPVRQNMAILAELPAHVAGSAVVTDTGSTKRAIVAAARALPARLTFVGGHPLGGAAQSGIGHARADLFSGRTWLLTPGGDASGEALERLSAFVSALGAIPRVMEPAEHDRLLAFTSHLPQLSVSALMSVVGAAAGRAGLQLSGRGLLDTTRLASSPPDIWKDVCATNADEIAQALDALIARLQDLRQHLDSGAAIDQVFESAKAWREVLIAGRS
jgi:prephenate dehydrogenase